MQGWSPDFIAKLANDVLTEQLVDEFVGVNGEESLRLSRELACKEGIFCGISAGATFHGALQVAQRAEPGSVILCMLPDTGERYLSTPLFDDIPADMSTEELDISRSTAGYQFGATVPAARPESSPIPASEEALAFVEKVVADPARPVVMFALEWCEFCWSVRKLFEELGVEFLCLDLDSIEFQQGDRGGEIRRALSERLGSPTIPQIFVGADYVGGATETFDAYNDGRLQKLFDSNGIRFERDRTVDAYSFLPGWLHPREQAGG